MKMEAREESGGESSEIYNVFHGDSERQARLRMVVYSFIISCSFRLPLRPVDDQDPPVM